MGKKHQVQPTQRDSEIFRYVSMLRVVTRDQVYHMFWEGRRKQTCKDRLEELVRAGYLHMQKVTLRGKQEEVYQISRRTYLDLPEEQRFRLSWQKAAPNAIPHLLYAGEIYNRLHKRYTLTDYRSESDLRAEGGGGPIPEPADFGISIDGMPILVEIDSVHYRGERLLRKIASLGSTGKRVLWVVHSERRMKTVAQAAREYATIQVSM